MRTAATLATKVRVPVPAGRPSSWPAGREACLAFLLVWLPALPAHALSDPAEMLHDAAQEARAEQIGSQLRCLVCQNESIEDSGADLAKDLRAIVRQRVVAGDTDGQVVAWMVARYGNFVRLRPPFTWATLLLWLSPVMGLLAGVVGVLVVRRRQAAIPAPLPLTEAERSRLAELTGP
ncbi:MAG: cytochrome c-type biogenesis protein [Janthinobacterium lividum]